MSHPIVLLALLQYGGCPAPQTPTPIPPAPPTLAPPAPTDRPSGPSTPGPSATGPSTPAPALGGPTTPGFLPGGGGPRTGGGIDLGPELDWRDWWWLNGYTFLRPWDRRAPITPRGDEIRIPVDASANSLAVERAAAAAAIRRALRDDDPRVRATAALSAGRLSDESFRPELVAFLQDPNPLVRQGAIAGLGLLAEEEVVPPLLRLGRGESGTSAVTHEDRDLALLALGIAATRGTTSRFALPLRAFLGESSTNDLRLFGASTAASLALSGDAPVLDRIAAIAADRKADPALRARSLWALRAAGSVAHREVVLGSLADRNVDVRRAAALALGGLAEGDAARVASALREAIESDGDVAVRAFALLALGEVGGDDAKREILQRLTRGKQMLRPWAAIAAGILARPTADPEIGAVLARCLAEEKNRDTRAALSLAVGLSRTPDGREGVRRLVLDGENSRERVFAALAVALGEDEDGREALRRGIREIPNPAVRASDALALAVFRDADDAATLVQVFETSEAPDAVGTAALALAWNGSRGAVERLRREVETSPRGERRAAAVLALGFAVSAEKVPSSLAATAAWNYMASLEAAHTAARLWM